MQMSFRPPPEGTSLNVRRRQVSWLAGLSPFPAFPKHLPQWPLGRASAYSCGGSRGLGQKARTAFPLGPFGTDDERNYRIECKARQTN